MQTKTVLVTGANGYIGHEVCLAFRNQGYTVLGMCRSMEKFKAAQLMQEEILPAIADYTKPETIKQFVEQAGIIIECATTTPTNEIIEMMISLTKAGKCEDGSPKLYIQTTGFMQYQFEDSVLGQEGIIPTVVRPAFIYGKSGGVVFHNLLFQKPAQGEKLNIAGMKEKVWPWCHISDLATLYVQIALNKSEVKGKLFRGGIINKEITYEKLRKAIAKCMGIDIKYEEPVGQLESMIAQVHVEEFDNESSKKIGWKPFYSCNPIDQMDIHYKSYLASKE